MSDNIVDALDRHEHILFSIEGVIGVGIEDDKSGDPVIMVRLKDSSSKDKVPQEIEGFAVHVEITGEIDAY